MGIIPPALLWHVNSPPHSTSRLQIGGEFTFPLYNTLGIFWGTLRISTAFLNLLISYVDSMHKSSWFCSKLNSDTTKVMQRQEEELHTQHLMTDNKMQTVEMLKSRLSVRFFLKKRHEAKATQKDNFSYFKIFLVWTKIPKWSSQQIQKHQLKDPSNRTTEKF